MVKKITKKEIYRIAGTFNRHLSSTEAIMTKENQGVSLSPESCIGKIARYRKDHEREIKTGEVLAVKKFTNIAGDIETDFKMANGDIVNAASCYFEIL